MNNKHFFAFSIVVGIATLITFILFFYEIPPNKKVYVLPFVLVFLIGVYLLALFSYRDQEDQIEKLKEEKKNLESSITQKEKEIADLKIKPDPEYPRFEEVKNRKRLTYGFVEYKPFFWKEGLNPRGIGLNVLKSVFEIFPNFKLTECNYEGRQDGSNWGSVFTDLSLDKFDIILTPLFETRTRLYSYNIAYCIPLFYSNIGIYAHKERVQLEKKKNFKEAKQFLLDQIRHSHWQGETIPGEISEILLRKLLKNYGPNNKANNPPLILPATDNDFAKVLKNVNDLNLSSHFVFMEVFKANAIINKHPGKFQLVNILEDNELLYPVSFVVKKKETVLRSLINLRLIELRDSGKLEELIKEETLSAGIKEEEFENIFVQHYDFSKFD